MRERRSYLQQIRRSVAAYFVDPITTVLVKLGISADAITVVGLLIGLAGAVFVAIGWLWIGGLVILLSSAMDLFDGSVARARGEASIYGALLDTLSDRIQESAVFFALVWYFLFNYTGDPLLGVEPIILVTIGYMGAFMTSYVRARAESYGVTGSSGIITRPERVIIIVVFLLISQPVLLAWVMAIATLIGATLRTLSVTRRIRAKLKAAKLRNERLAENSDADDDPSDQAAAAQATTKTDPPADQTKPPTP